MEAETAVSPLDFAARFQRVQGRTPRKCSATAKMTREEHNELEAAASTQGKPLGEWAREVLLGAARGFTVDPAFTEVIAIRLLLNSVLQHVACAEMMTRVAFNAEMQEIRTTKHKAAQEVMQQYAAAERSK